MKLKILIYNANWSTAFKFQHTDLSRATVLWDMMPYGIWYHMGYDTIWDMMPYGIWYHLGYDAIRDMIPFGIWCHMGYDTIWDMMPYGIWYHLFNQSVPAVWKKRELSKCEETDQQVTQHPIPENRIHNHINSEGIQVILHFKIKCILCLEGLNILHRIE
jgi:hypothetical protein